MQGVYDAVFDEGVRHWADIVLDQGMTFLPLDDATLSYFEQIGFRRATISKRALS